LVPACLSSALRHHRWSGLGWCGMVYDGMGWVTAAGALAAADRVETGNLCYSSLN